MIKLNLTLCKICGETKSSRGFSFHVSKTHDLDIEEYIIGYELNGITPLCKCGCGEIVTIRGYQIMEYLNGHSDIGHFKKGKSPKRDYVSWKEKTIQGIRSYHTNMKSIDPHYMSGENNSFYGKHHSQKAKKIIKMKVEKQIQEQRHPFIGRSFKRVKRSSLELQFEEYLLSKSIDFISNFKLSFIPKNKTSVRYKYYDFYLPQINILIEINGSYWHPKENINLDHIQKRNFHNDLFKKQLSKKQNYWCLTIYDYELESFIANDVLHDLFEWFNTFKFDLSMSGFLQNQQTINIPKYMNKYCDLNTLTINLASVNHEQQLYVESISPDSIIVGNETETPIHCYYMINAERIDVPKIEVEF